MSRIAEYHFDGMNPLQIAKLFGLAAMWLLLFLIASQLEVWEGIVLISIISIFTAVVWRQIITSVRAGSWLTETHFHVYFDHKHWSFPLSGVAAIRGRRTLFTMRSPQLILISGRRVSLPITAIPPVSQLRRWFANSKVDVGALARN